ncbi:MAG: restriction endonuclease subunit S [Donghicola eburneus]|nr:restriction endonuclease subunit S [Donghicola eburneus]MCI5039760.1 restriction endonuclease subunit S [Donghicola eburneus]
MKNIAKAGWEVAPLGTVAQIRPNKKEVKSTLSDEDEVSFVPMDCLGVDQVTLAEHQTRPLREVYGGYTYFRNGDVLLAKITPCFENGKLGIADDLTNGIGFGSSEFVVLRPSEKLFAGYLYHFLNRRSFRDWAKGLMTGAVGHKRVPKELIETLEIPLPPVEEQRRIVEVLDKAFEGLARARTNAETNLANARELLSNVINGFMQEAGSGFVKLGSVCKFENGDRGKNYPGRKAFVPEGVPFINAGHLLNGPIDWDHMNYIPEDHFHRLSNGKVRKGDLLFCLRGSLGKFGKVDTDGLGAIASSLVIVRPSSELLGDYLAAFFESKACADAIAEFEGGAAQPNLSAKSLAAFPIALPSLSDQSKIVGKIAETRKKVEALITELQFKLKDIDNLRQSLLQKAFAGELT